MTPTATDPGHARARSDAHDVAGPAGGRRAQQGAPEQRMADHHVPRAKRGQHAARRLAAQIVERRVELGRQHQGEQQAVDRLRRHRRAHPAPTRQQACPCLGLPRQLLRRVRMAARFAGASRRSDGDPRAATFERARAGSQPARQRRRGQQIVSEAAVVQVESLGQGGGQTQPLERVRTPGRPRRGPPRRSASDQGAPATARPAVAGAPRSRSDRPGSAPAPMARATNAWRRPGPAPWWSSPRHAGLAATLS